MAIKTDIAPNAYEAESYRLGRTTSGPPSATQMNARASEGEWVWFSGEKPGDWLQLTVPDLLPGRYRLMLRYCTDERMGKVKVEAGEADGSDLVMINECFDLNEFAEGEENPAFPARSHRRKGFLEADLGEVNFGCPGYKSIRFTLLSREGGALGIGLDRLAFVPAFQQGLRDPRGLRVAKQGPGWAALAWDSLGEPCEGYLVELQGPPFSEWTLAGYTPTAKSAFACIGLRPEEAYRYRVRAYSRKAIGAPSAEVVARSEALPQNPLGQVIENKGSRSGESTVIKLKSGRYLMYLNYQDQTDDFGSFTIGRKTSDDKGKSWSPMEVAWGDESGEIGYMMPSLLRMADGRIGLSYCQRKQSDLTAHRMFCVSEDEGESWSDPVTITSDLPVESEGKLYTGATGPHDRLIQAANGDLLLPVHYTTGIGDEDTDPYHDRTHRLLVSATAVYRSSDSGESWQRVFGPAKLKGTAQRLPYRYPWLDQVLSEPSLVEYQPGRLLLAMRNQSGWVYQARSEDGGSTWSALHQAPVRCTLSPPKLMKVDESTIALIIIPNVEYTEGNLGLRYCLASLTSRDGGLTWLNPKLLDGLDPRSGRSHFAYPSFLKDGDKWLAWYFGPKGMQLSQRELPGDWFFSE